MGIEKNIKNFLNDLSLECIFCQLKIFYETGKYQEGTLENYI